MNYNGKKVALTGASGFIGSALHKSLLDLGASVDVLWGDIRNPGTFSELKHEHDYLFHFAAPSSQVLFKRQSLHATQVTINGFINATEACRKSGIKLIYPSTGLLSAGEANEYARCKKICEDIHLGENLDALGLRIFATYGPGEGHKRDYASVPYLFASSMYFGKRPEIWGNGKQSRDFIFIKDTVNAVLTLAEEASEPIIDVGSGTSTSFLQIYADLIEAFKIGSGAKIPAPMFIGKPKGYVDSTVADVTIMNKYCIAGYDTADGMHALVRGIGKEHA